MGNAKDVHDKAAVFEKFCLVYERAFKRWAAEHERGTRVAPFISLMVLTGDVLVNAGVVNLLGETSVTDVHERVMAAVVVQLETIDLAVCVHEQISGGKAEKGAALPTVKFVIMSRQWTARVECSAGTAQDKVKQTPLSIGNMVER
jgi:hypothetical protein